MKNKIIIDEQVDSLNHFEGELQITKNDCLLHLYGVNKITKLNLLEHSTLTLQLHDEASLTFEDAWSKENSQITLIINSENDTKLFLNLVIEAQRDYHLTLKNNVLGNNNHSNIQVHALTNHSGSIYLKSTGLIASHTQNNEFLEELKGLILEQKPIIFLPDLMVESDDVNAIHNATIKCIDEMELFYLQSKGIPKKFAIDLIKDGFLQLKNQGGENYES